jgi:hypothetical protein
MIRVLRKLIKWLLLAVVLLILAVLSPIGYVEFFCRGDIRPTSYKPVITDAKFRRPEANTYLTYPEWHIVYAYDGLAETLKTGDEYQFQYFDSMIGFWSSTCKLMRIADDHGGADRATRTMIYTIGASFNLEMALKAAYEETLGRLFAAIRGPEKTPQDEEAVKMALDYSAFLRQTPWYKYDFEHAEQALWAAPLTNPWRGWERRLALGGEWKAKTYYAKAIGAAVAATGEAQLRIRSVIYGIPVDTLKTMANVTVISDTPDGVLIETPRYDIFTHVLANIVLKGGSVREIAGNNEIMVSLTTPPGTDYNGPGEIITRMNRDGFQTDRLLVNLQVSELEQLFKAYPIADPGLEHVFDY